MHKKNKINIKLILIIFFIILTSGKQLYFQFSIKLSTFPVFKEKNMYMFLSVLALSVLIPMLFSYLNYRKILWISFFAGMFISMLIFSDLIYYRYYNNVLTIPVLKQFGLVSSIGDSIVALIKVHDYLLFADLPIYILFILFYKSKNIEKKSRSKKLIAPGALAGIGITCLIIVFSNISTYSFQFDNNFVISRMGVLYFHTTNISKYINENLLKSKKYTEKEKTDIIDLIESKKNNTNNYFGIAEGKNLIVVQMEAMQEFLIDRSINGIEITPNLNRFKKESIYLANTYYQTAAGNTADAEFIMNTSLYPANEGAAFFRYVNNDYYSLGKILKTKGYQTYAAHANSSGFWNRFDMYKTLDLDNFFDRTKFINNHNIGWGLADDSFYKQTLEKIDYSKPFYSIMISLSSHYPFNCFSYDNIGVSNIENELMQNYIKAANYADEAFGKLLEDLKERNLLESSVILIYGDHQAIPKGNIEALEELEGHKINEVEWLHMQRVPAFIYAKDLKPQIIEKVTGQIDFMPTVLNLLGIKEHMCLGKDILNSDSGYVVLRNGDIVTDDFIFLNEKSKSYDYNYNELPENQNIKIVDTLQKETIISDSILDKNFFHDLLNP